jgi:hypothetical protein|tara:strand:+ start:1073 stop:1438 length:366 start_codon:yes stop_codon:yes gene_type:complete
MKVKLLQIVNSVEALNKLSQQPMKAVTSFEVARNLKNISEELAIYEQSRGDLIRKFGKESKDGQIGIEPNTKEMKDFQKELGDLLNIEVDLNGFKQIKLKHLSKCELTPQEMGSLEFAIQE